MHTTSSVPKDKTLNELLSEISDTPCQSNEFIELTKRGLVEIGAMDDFDYDIFWNCMRIYESYGVNYFSFYILLRKGFYGDFTQGIESWFNSRSIMGHMPNVEHFKELVDVLRFFEIATYCNIDLSEYEKAYHNADKLFQGATDNEMQRRKEKRDETIRQRIENYFNYYDYSESHFSELSRNLITRQEKSISINEALALARFAPQSTYIVFLKNGSRVCHIGKTEKPLFYIGTNHKKFNADSAFFEIVDADYVDDLIICMRVLYDVELDRIRPSLSNRKYATLKQAIFAFNRSDGIPKRRIISAIEKNNLRTVALENDQVLIDKISLHRALYPSSNG